MANLIAVPQINGVAELLALLTRPTELAQTLGAMQSMIDEIDSRMGDIKTRDQADDLARRAAQAMLDANAMLVKARVESEELQDAAATVSRETADARDVLAAERATFEDEKSSFDSYQAQRLADIAKQDTQNAAASQALMARAAALDDAEQALAADKAAFNERLRQLAVPIAEGA